MFSWMLNQHWKNNSPHHTWSSNQTQSTYLSLYLQPDAYPSSLAQFVNGDWWENSWWKKGRQRRIETDQPQGRNYRITAPPLFANPPRDKSTAMRQTNQNFCSTLITNPSQFVGQIQRWSVICHLHGLHLSGGGRACQQRLCGLQQ